MHIFQPHLNSTDSEILQVILIYAKVWEYEKSSIFFAKIRVGRGLIGSKTGRLQLDSAADLLETLLKTEAWGPWVAQSVKHLTLDLSSGLDVGVMSLGNEFINKNK